MIIYAAREMGKRISGQVAAALFESRTTNAELLSTIGSLIGTAVADEILSPDFSPPPAAERTVESNLEVKKLGDEDSTRYKLAADLTISWSFNSQPFDEDFDGRRARREEKAEVRRLLKILVEDIRRTKRERAASQQRELTLEVDETPDH